jgi:hypothetical protein
MAHDPWARDLDALLTALRLSDLSYHLVSIPPRDVYERLYAQCPCCRSSVLTLELVEGTPGGPVTIRCWSECSETDIRLTLAVAVLPTAWRAVA